MLADVMQVEQVSVDSHFFDELGADSLVMAQFCARVRKREDLPSVSMKDIYAHPTIRSLAAAFGLADGRGQGGPGRDSHPDPAVADPILARSAAPASTRQYVVCGALQLLFFLGYAWAAALVGARAYEWISAGSGLEQIYLRSVAVRRRGLRRPVHPSDPGEVGADRPVEAAADPHLEPGLRPLLDRQDAGPVEPAGLPDRRLAAVRVYLRALGAKVGRGAVIFSRHVPVCTDLLTIGADTVIRKESFFSCYRAHAGRIQTGTVTLGRNVFIGEKTVLDINTSMGDGAQLGHASALHSGQAVPDGERWHGSPAQRTEVNYLRVAPGRCGTLRRVRFSAVTLLCVFFLYLPLLEGGVFLLLTAVPSLAKVLDPGTGAITLAGALRSTRWSSRWCSSSAPCSSACSLVVTVPRVLNLFIKPDKVYPLLRLPRPGPPGDRADDQHEVLHASLR